MTTLLYSLKIKCKRDVVLARLRARQLCGLLGYEKADQLLLAAATFELAWGTFQSRGRVVLNFTQKEDRLLIDCARPVPREEEERREYQPQRGGAGVLRRKANRKGREPLSLLDRALPKRPGAMAGEDVVWAMMQLARHTPLNLFEEIRQYNLELLELEGRVREPAEEAPRRPGTAA